jgi:hypothetical protein
MSSFSLRVFRVKQEKERERQRTERREIERGGREEGRQGVGGGFCSFFLAIVTCWERKKYGRR